jgi:hypothetical protein
MRSCIISRICICFIILCAFHFSFGCLSISKAFLKFTKQRDFCDKFKYGFNFSNLSFWQKGKAKQKRKKEKKKRKRLKARGKPFQPRTTVWPRPSITQTPKGYVFFLPAAADGPTPLVSAFFLLWTESEPSPTPSRRPIVIPTPTLTPRPRQLAYLNTPLSALTTQNPSRNPPPGCPKSETPRRRYCQGAPLFW